MKRRIKTSYFNCPSKESLFFCFFLKWQPSKCFKIKFTISCNKPRIAQPLEVWSLFAIINRSSVLRSCKSLGASLLQHTIGANFFSIKRLRALVEGAQQIFPFPALFPLLHKVVILIKELSLLVIVSSICPIICHGSLQCLSNLNSF